MARRRKRGALKEITALGQQLAEAYPWLDADELDHDESFSRLVELLSDQELVSDDAFEHSMQFGSKYVRAGTLAAIVCITFGLWRARALPWWGAMGLLVWFGYVFSGPETQAAALLNLALLLPFVAVARQLRSDRAIMPQAQPAAA